MTIEQAFFSQTPFTLQGGGQTLQWVSNLKAVLDHARGETGRDLASGSITDPQKTGSWLGNVAYLIMVDMLATIFSPPNPSKAKYTGFLTSRGFQAQDADVIYELRCSLAHEFGLVNKPNRIFTVMANPASPMITHPANPGLLNFGSIQPHQVTTVNLEVLADRLDQMVRDMKTEAGNGSLTAVLASTELRDRFFFYIGPIA
jgi:hypothetical protein